MPRTLPAGFMDALTADGAELCYALQLFEDEHPNVLRFWTGAGELAAGGKTWAGSGDLLQIEDLEETTDLKATGLRITLSGIENDLPYLALTGRCRGHWAAVYLGVLTGPNAALLDNLWDGEMAAVALADDGRTATATLQLEHALARLERPSAARFTAEYQRSQHPDDSGLDYVAAVTAKPVIWGPGTGTTRLGAAKD